MESSQNQLVGRDAWLSELRSALNRARESQGGAVLIRGEAGIGKTRLVEELSSEAQTQGGEVLWGRAWEVGGAPAYWPFTELVRALVRRRPELPESLPPARLSVLAQVLPELAQTAPEASFALSPAQARFMLLEALSCTLCDAAAQRPLLVVLEDMHAADLESLHALELLSLQARTSALLVVATMRPVPSAAPHLAPLFTRLARVARTIELPRLGRAEVARYARASLSSHLPEEALEALFQTSEGIPLFLVELTRLYAQRGTFGRSSELAGHALPASLRALIAQRLSALPEELRQVLEAAAVLGRELSVSALGRMLGMAGPVLEQLLAQAFDAAVLSSAPGKRVRFTHVLLRDVLYLELAESERAELHLRAADALSQETGRSAPSCSQLAHHLLRAAPLQGARAVEAARRAAEQALSQLAFEEAITWLTRALEAQHALGDGDRRREAELTLLLGRARNVAGDVQEGRALCARAADIARELGDAQLLGRAALECGRAFVFGSVDARLVRLLSEALAQLPERELSLRARLLARYAAAIQPAPDPDEPIAEARRALLLAREHGDARVLLETLRSVTSTMADLGDPVERRALNEELVACARELHEPLEELRGLARLTLDCGELGDSAGMRAALGHLGSLAERLAVPHARWLGYGLSAMAALFEGRFAEASQLWERAREQGERADDVNARRGVHVQRVVRLRLMGDPRAALTHLPEMREALAGISFAGAWCQLVEECLRAELAEPRPKLRPEVVDELIQLSDPGNLAMLCWLSFATGDLALAERVEPRYQRFASHFATWGGLGLCIDEPVDAGLGLLALTRGQVPLALQRLQSALAACQRAGARGHEARVAALLAHAFALPGASQDTARAEALREHARQLAQQLGIALPVLGRLANAPAAVAPSQPAPSPAGHDAQAADFALQRQGELWLLRVGAKTFHLEDTKGLRYLSVLLQSPGRSFHVLELAGVDPAEVDRGDAGELLDKRALDGYKRRVMELRERLEDELLSPQRREQLRCELEAVEEELGRALGLGGRARRQGSQVERARINVQRRIRDAFKRIEACAPELAKRLERSVRTGMLCVYDP